MHVSWQSLSRVVWERLLFVAYADGPNRDPRCRRQPDRQYNVQSGQRWIEGRGRPLNVRRQIAPTHHRTTGEPGQGVDGRLLCPVINKPSPNPPPGGLSQGLAAAAKGLLVAADA